MRRILFEIPIGRGIPVPSYGVMLAIGTLAGIWLAARRAEKGGFQKQQLADAGVLMVLWGVVGARIFFVLENHELFFGAGWRRALEVFAVWQGGLVYYGGLLAAIGYMVYHCMWGKGKAEPPRLAELWDIAAPSALVGVGFARIGCFLNGCCYGMPAGRFWGVRYPPGAPIFYEVLDPSTYTYQHYYELGVKSRMLPMCREWSFAVHPTQLYEAVFCWALGALLYWYWPRRKGNGEVGALFVGGYTVFRFMIEFIRINPPVFSWAPLSISQWLSIGGFAFAVWLFLASRGWIRSPWNWVGPRSLG